jgi:acylphosphatase
MTMERLTCHFSGHVQGVGFRYTVRNIALQYDVAGYVRNLPDGRVELVMEGPQGDCGGLLESVKERMARFIRNISMEMAPATGEFDAFYIRH